MDFFLAFLEIKMLKFKVKLSKNLYFIRFSSTYFQIKEQK